MSDSTGILLCKSFFKPLDTPILFESPQRTGAKLHLRPVVHVQQTRPKLRVVMPELSQLVYALQGAAPA